LILKKKTVVQGETYTNTNLFTTNFTWTSLGSIPDLHCGTV